MEPIWWEQFGETTVKRTIRSWAKDLRFVDVVQLRDDAGSLRYAILTPGSTRILDVSDDDSALAVVAPDDVDGFDTVCWEEARRDGWEMRLLGSWANDMGYVDLIQARELNDAGFISAPNYFVQTEDGWEELDATTDAEVCIGLYLQDDMEQVN